MKKAGIQPDAQMKGEMKGHRESAPGKVTGQREREKGFEAPEEIIIAKKTPVEVFALLSSSLVTG